MKEIEAVSAIMNERWVVFDPSLWPTSSENNFELTFGRFSHDDANAASECDSLTLNKRRPDKFQNVSPMNVTMANGISGSGMWFSRANNS